jgi:hypothetical protein
MCVHIKKWCGFLAINLLTVSFQINAVDHDDIGHVLVITGGYEAEAAKLKGVAINGPRTDAVRTFMDASGLKYAIKTVVWNRAFQKFREEPATLIYPLTRTPEREDQFDWIKEIDTHTYHLLGKVSLAEQGLMKKDIISGKYLAICEAATSNCSILRQFGFPEDAIIKVKGKSYVEMKQTLINGRASFTMDNYETYQSYELQHEKGQVVRIGDYSITTSEYLAGYKTDTKIKQHLLTFEYK